MAMPVASSLPGSQPPAARHPGDFMVPSRPAPVADANKPTVLFVDDEERILRSLRLTFARQYRIHTTTSGLDALDILRRERVHALVCDQRMPILPGVEVLRRAREISPKTVRLLLTGYSDLDAVAGSINEGEIFRYLSKPWNPDEIRQTIGKAVEVALELDTIEAPAVTMAAPTVDRLLVIDEDPQVASQIRTLVNTQAPGRIEVEWAGSVEAVLDILGKRDVAVVVTDVRLGREDLTPLIKSLKRHQPDIITIVLTHYQDSATLVGLVNQAQIHRYLLKPLRSQLTWRGIDSGLQRHHALKATPRLAVGHQVEASNEADDTPGARRLLGFFRSLRARLAG